MAMMRAGYLRDCTPSRRARSSSDSPPQIPYGSGIFNACSKQRSRTGQAWQTLLALWMRFSRAGPRSSGGWKNVVLAMPRQAAASCQSQCASWGPGSLLVSATVGKSFLRECVPGPAGGGGHGRLATRGMRNPAPFPARVHRTFGELPSWCTRMRLVEPGVFGGAPATMTTVSPGWYPGAIVHWRSGNRARRDRDADGAWSLPGRVANKSRQRE